jgi:IS5 family transposase
MLEKIRPNNQQNLFKTRLADLINLGHLLVKLENKLSWDKIELEFQNLYSEQGRFSIPIIKITGLLLLKDMFKESNEPVVERLIENKDICESRVKIAVEYTAKMERNIFQIICFKV